MVLVVIWVSSSTGRELTRVTVEIAARIIAVGVAGEA
jgi:hypothetical protein